MRSLEVGGLHFDSGDIHYVLACLCACVEESERGKKRGKVSKDGVHVDCNSVSVCACLCGGRWRLWASLSFDWADQWHMHNNLKASLDAHDTGPSPTAEIYMPSLPPTLPHTHTWEKWKWLAHTDRHRYIIKGKALSYISSCTNTTQELILLVYFAVIQSVQNRSD